MNSSTLSSTLIPTLLLCVGLFFFIKASVKDRTEKLSLAAEVTPDKLLTQLEQYFTQRSYRIAAIDSSHNQVIFEGFVRPSLFMAIFLTLLAAVGILCLSLVLSMLFPQWNGVWLGLLFLAPVAGVFYWKKAGRPEQVSLKVETILDETSENKSLITVTAHRDELAELQRFFPFRNTESPIT